MVVAVPVVAGNVEIVLQNAEVVVQNVEVVGGIVVVARMIGS